MADDDEASQREQILSTPDLADALESDRFKQFLDHLPVAIAVSELERSEHITYTNLAFERVTGRSSSEVIGKPWRNLPEGEPIAADAPLSDAIVAKEDYIGTFKIERGDGAVSVDAWSNIIEDEDGKPIFRLVALADISQRNDPEREAFEQQIRDKDTLLRELQHRVKNNLQMITALIRLEGRSMPDDATTDMLDRLAGRVEALATLYNSLMASGGEEAVDLGIYLSEVASAVMKAHATEGIRLDLKVDTWPVSINVAMPTGLVVNELLTNSLKHAFAGREGGTITLHSLVDDQGCRVILADDGAGFSNGVSWPQKGKMGALIAESLRENAKARIEVTSSPGRGVRVEIFFARVNAAPEAS
ncbi:MAG TPA: histidine kinase dimerization/phosphoacceptor domain -containing protein [Arsenicitalea sp.]|nr:histidine kinase dimerization/phosphoacceptor domain -containing protein [Arsenicitalea sp.]